MGNRKTRLWTTVVRMLILSTALLIVAFPAGGLAQPADEAPVKAEPMKEELAAARALFKEAMEDEKADDWQAALAKLTKVSQVIMTPQVRYHIALCHEHLGHLVEAINGFELAEQEARAAGDKAKNVATNAPARAEKLRGRVAHITITVEGTVRTSKILIDDKSVSIALVNTSIPIDPGTHVLQVKRDGEVQYERTLELGEGDSEQIDLQIDDPEPPPPPPDKPINGKPDKPVPPPEPTSPLPGYIIGGAGAAAIVVGGVLWGLREATIEEVRAGCDAGDINCNPDDVNTAQQGETYTALSYVAWAVGGAALVTGVTLVVLFSTDDKESEGSGDGEIKTEEAVSITIAPTLTGLQILGRF